MWKGFEFLLLRRSFGDDYVEARGNERVFFALDVSSSRGQGEQRESTEDSEWSEDLFHGFPDVGSGFSGRAVSYTHLTLPTEL